MPQIDFTDDSQVKEYISELIKDRKPLRWRYYDEAVNHAKELAVHFKGEKPIELLERYRPNEPLEIRNYRLENYEPKTKSKAKKIYNVLQRINNSKNYSIEFPEEVSSLIKSESTDNSLEQYTLHDYPYFGNLIQWIFEVAFKQSLCDPNGVICFRPLQTQAETEEGEAINDNEFNQPFGYLYHSRNVVDYVTDEYYTIMLDEKSPVRVGNIVKNEGFIFHVYTKNEIIEYRQVGNKVDKKFEINLLYQHNIGEVPVITLGGEYIDNTFPFMYESFAAGILPYWNEAITMDNDLKANYVQHLYLERVEVQVECDNSQCGKNGAEIGKVCSGEPGKHLTCNRCKGTGMITGRSPYGVTSVKKENLDPTNFEFPGVTYIDKPTEIVELVEKKVKSLIDDGFSAINMDILKEVGENQSGVAKTIDRTDLDSYLMAVSNNIFDNLIYYSFHYINLMRYGVVMKSSGSQMPTINKPTHFDVLSSQQLTQELGQNNALPEQLKDVILIDIINKKFPNDHFQREYNKAVIELDPLRGKTPDQILTEASAGWITDKAAILSSNISAFIIRAHEEVEGFFELDYADKMKILYKFVEEQKKEKAKEITLVEEDGSTENNTGAGSTGGASR